MSQTELLKRTARVLEQMGVPFMLTGSLASSLQGEPRATHDIDLVVDFPSTQTPALLRAFPPPDFYLSGEAVRQAVERRSMFNLLEVRAGDKVDFWLLTDDPFDQSRFRRRRPIDYDGVTLWVSAPEDTILMKLRWAEESGGSDRQMHDAQRVYEIQAGVIDLEYVATWVARLHLEDRWQQLLRDAQPLE